MEGEGELDTEFRSNEDKDLFRSNDENNDINNDQFTKLGAVENPDSAEEIR